MKPAALACLFLLAALPASTAETYTVGDGDGLRSGELRVRLWGIDAPELDQRCQRDGGPYACGVVARDMLRLLVGDDPVECREVEKDRYGRSVARCSVGGSDLGSLMVLAGWAVNYPEYSGGFYAHEQGKPPGAACGRAAS